MAVKREDERYSSDPMDQLSGVVERVEAAKQPAADAETGETEEPEQAPPVFRMKVTGDLRDTGKKRRR